MHKKMRYPFEKFMLTAEMTHESIQNTGDTFEMLGAFENVHVEEKMFAIKEHERHVSMHRYHVSKNKQR